METRLTLSHAAILLASLRQERGISQLQLADEAGVNASVVNRAERGADARLSTWAKLFAAMGCEVRLEVVGLCEEAGEILEVEADRRHEKRRQGLCAGKRRFY
ncbi:MAG TPA: helix-turn-helix transcriptional regulator [Elusimicrobiota bacterium]|jgi:transcriptional regulator with XRE-family HTH domain|nr:helix-turn-helix transcriptional regulator [Elusimicrobiota bacterium]